MIGKSYQRNVTTKGDGRLIVEIPKEIVQEHEIERGMPVYFYEKSSGIEMQFQENISQKNLDDYISFDNEIQIIGINDLSRLRNPLILTRTIDINKIIRRDYYQRLKSDLLAKITNHKGDVFIIFKFKEDSLDILKLRISTFLQLQTTGNIVVIDEYFGDEIIEWISPLCPQFILKIPKFLLSF